MALYNFANNTLKTSPKIINIQRAQTTQLPKCGDDQMGTNMQNKEGKMYNMDGSGEADKQG